MTIKTLEDLFIHELSDAYSAEKQMSKALPRLARAADASELAEAFQSHLQETEVQIERLEQVTQMLGMKLKRIKCEAMEGLVEEGKEIIDKVEQGPVRDAALIAAAQKVEHYEIASYGTLCAVARRLGHEQAADVLDQTLEEEKSTDRKLTALAEREANQQAARAA